MVYTLTSPAGNSATWSGWVSSTSDSSNTATVTSSTFDSVWGSWTSTDVGTSCSDSSVWIYWVDGKIARTQVVYVSDQKQLSDKQRAERDRQLAEAQEQRRLAYEADRERRRLEEEERIKLREKAEITAQELLLQLIGEEQMNIYRETGRVLVQGRTADYILNREGGIKRVEKDKMVDLCVHIESKFRYPKTDNIIGLLLMAQTNEDQLNKLANVVRTYDRPDELPLAARA